MLVVLVNHLKVREESEIGRMDGEHHSGGGGEIAGGTVTNDVGTLNFVGGIMSAFLAVRYLASEGLFSIFFFLFRRFGVPGFL